MIYRPFCNNRFDLIILEVLNKYSYSTPHRILFSVTLKKEKEKEATTGPLAISFTRAFLPYIFCSDFITGSLLLFISLAVTLTQPHVLNPFPSFLRAQRSFIARFTPLSLFLFFFYHFPLYAYRWVWLYSKKFKSLYLGVCMCVRAASFRVYSSVHAACINPLYTLPHGAALIFFIFFFFFFGPFTPSLSVSRIHIYEQSALTDELAYSCGRCRPSSVPGLTARP